MEFSKGVSDVGELQLLHLEIRDELPVERQILHALDQVLGELRNLRTNGENIMSALTDLQAADQLEASTLVTIGTAVSDVATRVTELTATLGNSDDPAVAAVAADLQAHVATLNTLATALAAIAPAATVTPVPNPVTADPGEAPAAIS